VLARLVVPICVAAAIVCHAACKRRRPDHDQPAPSASVITLGVALGACDDVPICERECDAGTADACRRLAITFALGHGAEKDETRATALYERACDMKDPMACVFAGQMLEYERGVPRDLAAAARFYERACDMHWAPGCYNFAIMVETGRGVPQDRAKAGDLYEVACVAGAKSACAKASALRQPEAIPFFDASVFR
jgi:TPR repeat protein